LKTSQFKNTTIAYTDTGGRNCNSFVPRFLENQKNVGHTLRLYKKNRVITIDLLGHGETECLSYVHSMEDNADAVHTRYYLNYAYAKLFS
jgi:pimeloyl-ACP methyl ester carboxylesterase